MFFDNPLCPIDWSKFIMSEADKYVNANSPQEKLTKAQALQEIYNAKYYAIQMIVEQLDRTIEVTDNDHFAIKEPTHHQIVAHYAVKAQLFKFKAEIQMQQHIAYVELKHQLEMLNGVK